MNVLIEINVAKRVFLTALCCYFGIRANFALKTKVTMIKSIKNAEHYKWGDNCDGWHLLKTDSLSVIQEKMPPGAFEKRHFHAEAQQLFYILSGTATFEMEGEAFVLNAGESIHVPKGAKHFISNHGSAELGFLVVSEPKSHGDRTEVNL